MLLFRSSFCGEFSSAVEFIKVKWRKAVLAIVVFVIGLLTFLSEPLSADEITPEWSYRGAANPTHWGEISRNFALCEFSKEQSPINIQDVVEGSPTQIVFNYNPTPLVVVNNGHTIQVRYAPGSTATIDGEDYELLQFHFHTPSEHTIEGKASAMELHLVHRSAAGHLSVIGVLMEEGAANPLIDEIWQHLPATKETNTVSDRTINAADLLPKKKAYFSYTGSLTTPPCSEEVRWNVLAEPITVSAAEISVFQKLYQMNARPVQSANGRIVELHNK